MANYLSDLQRQSQNYLSQINRLANEMKQYTPATASDALKEFNARVGNMAPQYGELRGIESQIQQTPGALMQQFQQAMGGTTGLDPMARLNQIQAAIANQGSTANVMRDVIGAQQGRLEQMANNAMGMYQQEQAAKQQQYANLNDMYKTIVGRIEAEKARQAAAAAAEAERRRIEDLTNRDRNQNTGGKVARVAPGAMYMDSTGTVQKNTTGNMLELDGEDATAYNNYLRNQAFDAISGIKQGAQNESFFNRFFNWNPMQGIANWFVKPKPSGGNRTW